MQKKKLIFLLFLIIITLQIFGQIARDQNFVGVHLSAYKLAGDQNFSAAGRMVGISFGHYFTPHFGVIGTGGSGYVVPRKSTTDTHWYADFYTSDELTKTYLYPIGLNLRLNAVGESPLIPYLSIGGGMLNWRVTNISDVNNNSIFTVAGETILDYNKESNLYGEIAGGMEIYFFGPVRLELSARYFTLVNQDKDMFAHGYVADDGTTDVNNIKEDIPTGALEGRIALNVHFGGKRDRDGDGIYDHLDTCPDDPEDFDKFEDEDGCPDLDNDGDGILDVNDQCPNDPEDIDEFEDADGCPDPDNDNDGILDVDDACPNEAEDFDGFEDEDGCPDPDNDNDGFLDADDGCPNEPEDKDGFADKDGCPDPDNDKDGILDVNDACPDDVETFNDYEDEDGCPDTVPEVVFTKEAPIVLEGVNFEFNSAALTVGAKEVLMKVVRTLRDYPDMELAIKGHTDNVGSYAYNLKLSDQRANSVKTFLVNNGIAGSRLDSIGYGEEKPIETNSTAEGRAKNRRIEFVRTK